MSSRATVAGVPAAGDHARVGGVLDPKTGRIVWTMHVPLAEQLAHYHTRSPSALCGLTVTPTDADHDFDGHGEPINAVFTVACGCSQALFSVSCGYTEDDELAPPVAITCAECRTRTVIFDASKHGWNAETLTPVEPLDVVMDDLALDEVPPPHELVLRFEYASDTLGDGEHTGREHDLFTWITILARDLRTGRLALLFDYECA